MKTKLVLGADGCSASEGSSLEVQVALPSVTYTATDSSICIRKMYLTSVQYWSTIHVLIFQLDSSVQDDRLKFCYLPFTTIATCCISFFI
jgi:hypothetical protein